jgi:hypothetical protein
VRLWLSMIAYNVANLWRRLVLQKRFDHWSLTSLQQQLAKNRQSFDQACSLLWLLVAESVATAIPGASLEPCFSGSQRNTGSIRILRKG